MLLRNKLHIYACFLLLNILIQNSDAKPLPVLATNQASNSIRYISHDGKFTYYQRRSGELVFSTNYSVSNVLADNPGSMFSIIGSYARKKLIISLDPFYFGFLNPSKSQKIYVIDYGNDKPVQIGTGNHTQLHLDDNWMSYCDVDNNSIQARSTTNELLAVKIALKNTLNPHFRPAIAMSSENHIYYTDLNNEGETALLHLDRVKQQTTVIEKQKDHNLQYEMCSNKNKIFIGTFPINGGSALAQIRSIDKSNPLFDKAEVVYERKTADIGSMVCDFSDSALYFVQSQNNDKKQPIHEIVRLNLSDKKTQVLTDFKSATNVFNMDGRLLTFYNGQVFVLEGDNSLATSINLPKSSALPEPEPEPGPAQVPTSTEQPTQNPPGAEAKTTTPEGNSEKKP